MSFSSAIAAAVGISLGHFIYQAMTGHQWDVAMERTFFTTGACLAMFLAAK